MSDPGSARHDEGELSPTPDREAAAERRVAICLVVATLAALGLAGVYVAGGQPQLEGSLLFSSLFSLGLGLVVWGKELLPNQPVTASRGDHGSSEAVQEQAQASFERGQRGLGRRPFLVKLLGLSGASLGLAAVFPIRSLGPAPGESLYRTAWAAGTRVVREDGTPVRATDLGTDTATAGVDTIVTAFPEHFVDRADSVVVVINLGRDVAAKALGAAGSVEGIVAYSKVCTHAGCPVGLYRATGNTGPSRQLLCPCHQSTFDVLRGCRPVFGPAARPLPQLPLDVDADGVLIARSDFAAPIGPSFWNRG